MLSENRVGDQVTQKSVTFGRGQTHTTLTQAGNVLYIQTITEDGHFVLGTPEGSCRLDPVGTGFHTGVKLTFDNGAPSRTVRADDDVVAGRLRLFIDGQCIEEHEYDTDNGVLIRSSINYTNR